MTAHDIAYRPIGALFLGGFWRCFHPPFGCFPPFDVQPRFSQGLTEEIAGHASDIETATADRAKATEIRKTTRSDFVATLKDMGKPMPWVGEGELIFHCFFLLVGFSHENLLVFRKKLRIHPIGWRKKMQWFYFAIISSNGWGAIEKAAQASMEIYARTTLSPSMQWVVQWRSWRRSLSAWYEN